MSGVFFSNAAVADDLIEGWNKAPDIQVTLSNPKRTRRSPDAKVSANFINNSSQAIDGELRFFITKLIPETVSITNSSGKLAGLDYFTLILNEQTLAPGATLSIPQIIIAKGGRTSFEMEGFVYFLPATVPEPNPDLLTIDIVTPQSLLTYGASPIEVSGTISDITAELTINGVPITHTSKQFSAFVELQEGFNTIVARATNQQGAQVTDSIVASLDLTPPYLTVESPSKEQIVYTNSITVTGLVNDIVRGTVEVTQAQVQVNGINAQVSNRSYAAYNVPLVEGENTLTITGVDQSGNTATIKHNVTYKFISENKLSLISGQQQTSPIGTKLTEHLKVRLTNQEGLGIAGEAVVFRVIQGAGIVGADTDHFGRAVVVDTDEQGFASTVFQLGYRTGVANHKVKAKVVGFENEIIFNASATNVIADKISINSGNNQRGITLHDLPAPFVVAVTDSGANIVKGARVRFNVVAGAGKLQNGLTTFDTTTDSDGRASAQLLLGDNLANDAQRVNAVLLDSPVGTRLSAGFIATAYVAGPAGNTNVTGVVLDNQDTPIPGVIIRIENTDRTAITNEQGQFVIQQAPVGPIHLIADGSTATVLGEFPSLSYHLVTISGINNPLSSPIYMVKLDTENGIWAGPKDAVLTLDKYPGFKLEIVKDSVTFPDGSREGMISVTPVNASKVPMAPPNGMQPQFIVTIQPVGATFSPPAKLTLPNVDGHAPGAQVEMYSFDHDLEEFVAIGLGTVSEDGSIVSSNSGVGVIKAGWHCGSQPGGSGTAHNCPTCQKCDESSGNCVRDSAQDNNARPAEQQTPEDCKTALCSGSRAEPSDIPRSKDVAEDCRKPGCDGKNPKLDIANPTDIPVSKDIESDCKKPGCNGNQQIFDVPDDNDLSDDDKKCSTCSGGEKIVDPNTEAQACGGDDDTKSCYTCKEGSCGNHCNAPTDKTTKSIKVDSDHTLLKGLHILQAKSPYVKLELKGEFSINEEAGKKCCKDCSKGAEPKSYTKNTLKGSASLEATFIVPGVGLIYKLPAKTYGPLKLSGEIEFGPGAKGKLELAGAGTSEVSECEDDDCSELSMSATGNAAIGIFFEVKGEVEFCNIFNSKDCDKVIAGGAKANSAFHFSAGFTSKKFYGERCNKPDCTVYHYGKVEFKSGVEYEVIVGGIYKYQYSNEIAVSFSEPGQGGTCG